MSRLFLVAGFALAIAAGHANAQAGGQLQYCKADAARLCPGVRPGGGRLLKCMKEHENEVSIGCAKELKKLKG